MFGKRLKELREKTGYSMDKLVELYNKQYAAKMNKSTLSRYENNLQEPIYTVVVNFANFFNVSVDYISGYEKKDEIITSFTLDENEQSLITNYRTLSDQGKEYILQTMNMAINTYKKDNSTANVKKEIS